MTIRGNQLLIAGIGAALLCAAAPARAQGNSSAASPPPPPPNAPPRDFRLPGRTLVPAAEPQQQQQPPPVVAPPSPVTSGPPTAQPQPRQAALTPRRDAPAARSAPTPAPETAPPAESPAPLPEPVPVPLPAPAATSSEPAGLPWYYYAGPAALLGLLGVALIRRRRRREYEAYAMPELEAPAAPPAKLEPLLRPWLELELKAERAASTDAEAVVHFVLEIINSGKAAARNLRVDVKMFNAGQEQDKEIGAFFRTAGRESTKCNLPGIAPGTTGAIRGEVAMARDEMRAVVLEDKYLFIPVVAVNVLYDWGEGQTGQTSKSYVVGRELEEPSDKMGAFRVDLGPRIWRTVGQRQHKLARRV